MRVCPGCVTLSICCCYIPQIAMNHSRQSTEGWSIDNVLLDLSGGVLSLAQLLIACQVLNDWQAVTGESAAGPCAGWEAHRGGSLC
jgi:hypothetical protein